jgi:hypothetical protein
MQHSCFSLAFNKPGYLISDGCFNLQIVSKSRLRRKAMFKNLKIVFTLIAVLAIAVASYAFAAANTVPDTKAGDGTGAVSGYTVTSIVYTLNATDPDTLDSVSFDLGAAAATGKVKAQLVATTGDWYACTQVGVTTVWTCDTTGLTASSIDQLRVVAASN